jgi:ribosome-binding protein aMBF1 (putative translation factor)
MDHQDWNPVVLNNTTTKLKQASINKHVSQKASDDTLKVIAPPNLGKLMAQARGNKTRKNIAQQLGIAETLLTRWETGKDIPNNADIAKIERALGVKLPRVKKAKLTD